jgi:ankyrin repeat protein
MPKDKQEIDIIEQTDDIAAVGRKQRFLQRVAEKKKTLPQDRWIKESETSFMFWSKGNRYINLNGKYNSIDGRSIDCRHIAAARVFYDKTKTNINYHEAFKNPTAVPFLYENINDERKLINNADSYILLNVENIGQELSKLSKDMAEDSSVRIILATECHDLSIKIKNKGDNGFVVQFFDPNYTLVHKQIWFPDEASIASLKLSDLFDEDHKMVYLPRLNGFLAIYWHNEPLTSHSDLPEYLLGEDVSDIDQLYFGCRLGYKPWVSTAIQTILKSKPSDIAEIAAKSADGTTALYMALQNGHYEVVAEYIKFILIAELGEEQLEELLAGKRADNQSGFYMACQNGHYLSVLEYLDLILNSRLKEDQKERLLDDRHINGASGLYIACQLGLHQVVAIYVQRILNSRLSIETKEKLLTGKHANGIPALWQALYAGYHQTVAAYLKPILDSELDPEIKERLLVCKDINGVPGLLMAMQYGHSDTVAECVKLILISNLNNEQKERLLACKSANGIPGLWLAMQNSHFDTITEYIQSILASNLNNEQKERLLACKNVNDISGLRLAMSKGHYQTVATYAKLILNSELSSERKERLLACQPSIMHALDNGHYQAVTEYMQHILPSTLSDEQKANLLITKLVNGDPGQYKLLSGDQHRAMLAYLNGIQRLKPEYTSRCVNALISDLNEQQKIEFVHAMGSDIPHPVSMLIYASIETNRPQKNCSIL